MKSFSLACLLVVGCACALAAEGVPEYANSRILVDKAIEKVKELVFTHTYADNKIPNPKRNYAILVAVVNKLAEKLSKGPGTIYEKIYYDIVDEAVPDAWVNNAPLQESVKIRLDNFTDVTVPVRNLIQKYCKGTATVHCDEAVDLEVQTDPKKYAKSAAILLSAADLAKTYLADTREDYAKNNQIITFLLTKGQKELNELVYKYVSLHNVKV